MKWGGGVMESLDDGSLLDQHLLIPSQEGHNTASTALDLEEIAKAKAEAEAKYPWLEGKATAVFIMDFC
ncbi:hypothetical protein KIPB_014481 [Kipferlia bialata]|uniref:Uncharacterized protein n=1 Tax=Kipferlia bialata TaxID=797122 RepID=A0A9K3DCC9_9EUKA|nr:hypothetical protein KIPB_014481 [Kipferlia bialata]|eukprot:g14481.t1